MNTQRNSYAPRPRPFPTRSRYPNYGRRRRNNFTRRPKRTFPPIVRQLLTAGKTLIYQNPYEATGWQNWGRQFQNYSLHQQNFRCSVIAKHLTPVAPTVDIRRDAAVVRPQTVEDKAAIFQARMAETTNEETNIFKQAAKKRPSQKSTSASQSSDMGSSSQTVLVQNLSNLKQAQKVQKQAIEEQKREAKANQRDMELLRMREENQRLQETMRDKESQLLTLQQELESIKTELKQAQIGFNTKMAMASKMHNEILKKGSSDISEYMNEQQKEWESMLQQLQGRKQNLETQLKKQYALQSRLVADNEKLKEKLEKTENALTKYRALAPPTREENTIQSKI